VILIASQGAAVVVYNTCAKMFVIVKEYELAAMIAMWFIASASFMISSMVATVAVDQSKYVPIGKYIAVSLSVLSCPKLPINNKCLPRPLPQQ
jgi:hypothetical protein